jgi:hypothetical protein
MWGNGFPGKPSDLSKTFALSNCFLAALCFGQIAQTGFTQNPQNQDEEQFGPVVSAYLGYLRNEQEVVDDRASRREISRLYYRRNSNRIRALREIAIRIARESGNDYLPELEAVASDELGTLFERPPNVTTLPVGKVLNNTFRYIGSVRSGEPFYVFARLDPYEQLELNEKGGATGAQRKPGSAKPGVSITRPRRVISP